MAKLQKDPNKEKKDKIFGLASQLLVAQVPESNGLYNLDSSEVDWALDLAKQLYRKVYDDDKNEY